MARARTLVLNTKVNVTGADKLKGLGDRLSDVGRKMTTFVTLPLLGAGVAAFKFASDLEEATSKAATVFGDAVGIIDKEAGNLNDILDEATFRDMAGTFGALLKNMEFTADEAANLSVEWIKLSQDMASFHNVDPTEALNAIRSALSGEFEPLKRFGVMLNVASIEAKALEAGLWDGTGALDAQTRALIINQELFAKQPDVIGDLERTAGGAANATRILMQNFKDTAAALGTELLPLGIELLKTVNGWVRSFKALDPETRQWIVRVAAIAAAIGPVLFVFGKLLSAVKLFASAGGLVVHGWRHFPTLLGYLDLGVAKFKAMRIAAVGMAGALAGVLLIANEFGDDITAVGVNINRAFNLPRPPKWFMDTMNISLDPTSAEFLRFGDAVKDTADTISRSLGKTFADVSKGVNGVAAEFGTLDEKMADALLADQFQPLRSAIDELNAFTRQALSPAQEIFRAQSFLNSREYALALTSNNPLVRQKAQEMGDAAKAVLDRLDGGSAGARFATTFATGIQRNAWRAVNVTSAMAAQVMRLMPRSEPKDPSSPFRGITKGWGFMNTLAKGFTHGAGAVPKALAGMLAMPGLAAVPAGASSGMVIVNNNFTFHGTESGGPNELSSLLQRLSAVSDGSVRYG